MEKSEKFETLYSLPPYNFLGLDGEHSDFGKAKFVVIPVPYDSTASYRAGARNGPKAIISASRNVELFDLELKREPYEVGVATLDEIEPARGDSSLTVQRIKEVVSEVVEKGKIPVIIGGEHTVSLGAIGAFGEDTVVVSLDAHADLREEYEGCKISHACVMRRAVEQKKGLLEIGIRSLSGDEFRFAGENKIPIYYMRDIREKGLDAVLKDVEKKLRGKKVYLSIDIDAIDPGEAPGTGTPEPGGLHYDEVVQIVSKVCSAGKVVGFDVVEVAPTGTDNVTEFLAAKLIYKIIGYLSGK